MNREKKAIEEAVKLLEEALHDVEEFSQLHLKGDLLNTYIAILVDAESYDEAVKSFKDEIEKNKANQKSPPFTVIKI